MRSLLSSFCLLLMTACTGSPVGPTSPLNTEFTLSPGETMGIEGASLTVRFKGVQGDSRCPADAICVLGGSAAVQITVSSSNLGGTRDYDLHTGDMRPVQHGGVTIALVQLSPYPFSARPIQPSEYRATLKASRL